MQPRLMNSYIQSLLYLVHLSVTSSSVWINLPFATCLIILLRYLSLDFDIKRKAVMHIKDQKDSMTKEALIQRRSSVELHTTPKEPEKIDWRKKVNSPSVEAAIEKFTRHIISEWVTDLWYSRITPDKEGPEELVNLVNSMLGEVAYRARDVNLINLLTRSFVWVQYLICLITFCNFSKMLVFNEWIESLFPFIFYGCRVMWALQGFRSAYPVVVFSVI